MATISAIVRIGADISSLQQNVDKGAQALGRFEKTAKQVGGALAAAFSVQAIAQATSEMVDSASQIADAAQRMGIGAEAVQRLAFAAEQGGSSLDAVGTAMGKMADNLTDPSKGVVAAMETLGLDITKLTQMSPDRAFVAIADAIKNVPDPLQQSALAVDVFGKSARDLLPAIKAGFADVGAGAALMREETVASLDDAGDRWEAMQKRLQAVKANALAPLLETFFAMPESLQVASAGLAAFLPNLQTLATGLLAIGGPSGAMALLSTAGAALVTFFTVSLPAAFSAILPFLGPVGLIAVAVGAVYLAWKHWDSITEIVIGVYTAVKTWLVDKFAQVVAWIGEKVGQVTGFFRDMYDAVVGNSYVPDMIEGIADEFGKLDAVMVTPAASALQKVVGLFGQAMPSIGGLVSDGFKVVKGIASAFTGDFSGIIGGIIAGINLAKAAWRGLQSLFGGGEEGVDVNPNRDKFFAQYGGYEGLAQKLTAASDGNIAEGLIRALYAADTRAMFEAAQRPIVDLIGGNMFRNGSNGIRDFGSGTFAMLHGREEIRTEGQARSDDATAVGLRALTQRVDDLPRRLANEIVGAINNHGRFKMA